MLLLLFISSNFSLITCIPTLLGDIALFIVGFLTGAFDEDDAPVSSCAVSASSTLGVLLSLGMLIVAPNACGWGCFLLLFLLWAVWWLWMGLPEILSSPALAVLVSASLLWTVSRLRVSSFLLLVLPKCPLLLRCRALHLRSFLIVPPSTSFGDLPFWLVCWLVFVLVLSWTVSLPRLRRVWWRLSVLMLLVLLLTLPLLFLLLWRLLWWLVWMI